MGLVQTYPMQGFQPSRFRHLAERNAVALPWGGPTNGGIPYLQGSALTLVGGTAQPEIWSLTLSGAGNFQLLFNASGNIYYTGLLNAATVTAGQLQTALNNIWPAWVLPAGSVTGTVGAGFTITFGGSQGYNGAGNYSRIGGLVSFTFSGTANAVFNRTQRGSVGAGQYDYADGVTNLTCSAFLVDTVPLGPTGVIDTIPYGPNNDQTDTLWAWVEGFFPTNIYSPSSNTITLTSPNLTDAIVAATTAINKMGFFIGNTIETPGAEVRLIQA